MTFTEAAIEVLRQSGKPLHFRDIATEAVAKKLLSHVGQLPEATMGERLLALSARETDRRIVALPEAGVFALPEWNLGAASTPPPVPELTEEPPAEAPYRPKERHPPMQGEHVVGGRRDRDDRRRSRDDDGDRKRRFPPPAEAAWQWLREQGRPASLNEIAEALLAAEKLPEALQRDLGSFQKALREENRRRADSGRGAFFSFAGDQVTALEPAPRGEKPARGEAARSDTAAPPPKGRELARTPGAGQALFDEQRRNVLRSVRRRVTGLDAAALEKVSVALLEAQGYRDLNLVGRPREGATYLARRRFGASDLRFVIRILRPGRDLGRNEVKELRAALTKYSQQLGVVIGNAECTRDARSESNTPREAPIVLFGSEALAEGLVEAGLGVQKLLVEWLEFDDAFFASAGAGEPLPPAPPEGDAPPADADAEAAAATDAEASDTAETPADAPAAADASPAEPGAPADGAESPDRPRRRRDRRDRRGRRGDSPQGAPAATGEGGEAPAEGAPSASATVSAEASVFEAAPADAPVAPAPAPEASEPRPSAPSEPDGQGQLAFGLPTRPEGG